MELRKYQKETVDLILENIAKGVKSQLINSPTGSGKTFISASVIQELNKQGKRVFFLVANEPLIMQTYDEFGKFNLSRSIIKSGKDKYYNPNALNQIVMIQTYISRMKKLKELKPDILYFDEADFYSKGKSVQKIKEHFPDIQIVGVTASPTDTRGYLLDNFDFYHEVVTVRQLQKEGYLSIVTTKQNQKHCRDCLNPTYKKINFNIAEIIRQEKFLTHRELAKKYGLGKTEIGYILQGKRWKNETN